MKVKTLISAVALALASAGPVGLAVAGSTAVYAADKEKTVSAKVGKPLKAAQDALKARNPREALKALAEADDISGKTPFENLVLNQMKVTAYAQLGDNASLAKAAEAVLASGQLSGSELSMYKQAAAKAYYESGNMAKFAELAKSDASLQPLLAQSYLKQGNYAAAESTIRQVINSGDTKEEYYLILSEAQRKSGNLAGAADTIGTLLRAHPKPEYWKFVLGNMLNEKGVSDKGRLDIYRLMYATDSFAGAEDYTSMAETAIVAKVPGDAKRTLDKGFKAGVLGAGEGAAREKRLQATANARTAEDLKSLPGIEAAAAAQPGGDALAGIADSYLGGGEYGRAVGLYVQALSKGNLSDPAATKLHLGIAYAGSKQNEAARKTFAGVPGKGLNKQLANLWMITLR
jgi:tetratricopeptide (TPR) repeat protein